MSAVMMQCGHSGNATDANGKPCCAICAGVVGGHDIVVVPPDLAGRQAKCSCGRVEASDPSKLAFFEYCGPGSREAAHICKCGYSTVAHSPEALERNRSLKCRDFNSRGPREFDRYYCGHAGWD